VTALGQATAGLAVALGFALLGARRPVGMAMLCAAQAVVVAIGALAGGEVGVAAVELIEAGMLGWVTGMGRIGGTRLSLPLREGVGGRGSCAADPSPQPPPSRGGRVEHLIAGAMLTALAATIPETGLPLAVILLGLLLVALRPTPLHQALGIVATQNGLVLAGVAAGLANWQLTLVALPLLPGLGLAALWLGTDRGRIAGLLAPRRAAWIDAALCGLALLLAFTLPWRLGVGGTFWVLDARAAHVILLLAALAAAASWARRHASQVWGSQFAVLAGTVLAVLSTEPLLNWLGMTLATAGAVAGALPIRAEAWRRLRLGCMGLGLALFGAIAMHATPPSLPASACLMLGYSALGMLAPELTVAAIALILRVRATPTDDLLVVLGLAALLVAAIGLITHSPQRRTLKLVGLAQGGAAVFAFGLGTDGGNLAGLLQLSFLALTQCALLLAQRDGLDRLAAIAGLTGVPPFGLFPSLALILAATAEYEPWLLLPLGAGLAAVAWAVLLQLPAERRLLPSLAWVPLALLLIAGFAMPDPLLAWFRLAAR
jgi:hydrogenase-4 component F